MVDLNDCLEECARLVTPQLLGHRIELDLDPLPQQRCNPRQLNQVFFNIMLNASQACEEPSKIEVLSRVDGGSVLVTVRDSGVGIPPDSVKRIFDPGFTTRGVGVGTGLGLSIALQVVSDHGGSIDVDSSVREGSSFIIRLPIKR